MTETRQITKTVELSYDAIRDLPCQAIDAYASVAESVTRAGFEAVEGKTLAELELAVGDDVVAYSRGNYRAARIVKVGRTNVVVAYVTPTSVREAQEAALAYAGRNEQEIRARAAQWFIGWENEAERLEKIETYVADELAKGERARAEGYAAFVTVTTKSVKAEELVGRKINGQAEEPACPFCAPDELCSEHVGTVDRDAAIEQVASELETPAMADAIRRVEDLTMGDDEREVVQVGLDGRSQPMLRYRDELDRPDHARSIVSPADRARVLPAQTCTTCNRPADDGYVNVAAGEACMDPIHGRRSREAAIVEAAEARVVEIHVEIERMRGEQVRRRAPGNVMGLDRPVFVETAEEFSRRMAAWRERWDRLFIELRATEKRIAELSPLPPAQARELSQKALEARAAEVEILAHDHGMGPDYYREAAALRKVAAILADDGTSPYRMVLIDDVAADLAAALIAAGIPQGKAWRAAREAAKP